MAAWGDASLWCMVADAKGDTEAASCLSEMTAQPFARSS